MPIGTTVNGEYCCTHLQGYLFARVKEYLWRKHFELEDDVNSAVTASLHHLSKDEYTPSIDRLPHRWEKCVDSAGDYNE
jgi:hypothetical protein